MKLLKLEKRKGISPLIATLLLIAIAVAASVLTYSWVMSMIGSQSAQAQTQVRIDSVTWTGLTGVTAVVRNTGSVDAQIESVSIRRNSSGSKANTTATLNKAILVGTKQDLGPYTSSDIAGLSLVKAQSYVVRVTTTSGFYYEAVFSTPA